MKRILLITFFSILNIYSLGQSRIGFDFSTRFNSLNGTLSYHKVFNSNFVYSVGFFMGSVGSSIVLNDSLNLYNSTGIVPPSRNVPSTYTDTFTTYSFLDYQMSGQALGIQLGIGYYKEFANNHGVRVNLYSKFGLGWSIIRSYYHSTFNYNETVRRTITQHYIASISPEIYHTIRTSERNTFYWGLKLPIYYLIDTHNYHPSKYKSLFYGCEPELTIGLTRAIGKCTKQPPREK